LKSVKVLFEQEGAKLELLLECKSIPAYASMKDPVDPVGINSRSTSRI
jgi:hypothetical protein